MYIDFCRLIINIPEISLRKNFKNILPRNKNFPDRKVFVA